MSWLDAALLSILIAVAAAIVRARTLDVPAQRYHRIAGPDTPGDHRTENVFTAVRAVAEPAETLRALSEVAEAAARTTRLAGSVAGGHVSYVTRSRIFGFPDVTNIWISGGRVHVRGQAVVGRGDMGVNRRRVLNWLGRAGIA